MRTEIQRARMEDIPRIHQILGHYAEKGLLLPRSLSELYDHVRDFFVLKEMAEQSGRILGVGGLGVCWEDLAEVKSLAVPEEFAGRGYGKRLVRACLREARRLGIRRVFVLTYVPGFFEKMGFEKVDKAELPHKIWADCLKCPKFPNCDETALLKEC